MAYRNGKPGNPYYVKRFYVDGITHDRIYDLTMGETGSKVVYFSANPNGEAEVIKVMLRPAPKLKKTSFDYDFATLDIKGRASRGNKLTNHPVNRIFKREEGVSTLSAREIWYDDTVKRLNADGRGVSIGRYSGNDRIMQIHANGEFRLTNFDLSTHFDDDMTMIFKFEPETIFTVLYIEAETKLMYIKRFTVEEDTPLNKRISFIGEGEDAKLIAVNMDLLPRLLLKFNDGVSGKHFEDEELNVDEYIGVKSYKARGKRLSVHDVNYYEFLEPFEPPVVEEEPESVEETTEEPVEETVEISENSKNTEDKENTEISENSNDDNKDGQLTLF